MRLTITARAGEAIAARARDAGVDGWLLRIAVVAGGCNGLTYDLFFIPEASPEDAVIEAEAVRVAVDPASQKLLDGTAIDLPRAESFSFENLRARKSCSCGASFEV